MRDFLKGCGEGVWETEVVKREEGGEIDPIEVDVDGFQ